MKNFYNYSHLCIVELIRVLTIAVLSLSVVQLSLAEADYSNAKLFVQNRLLVKFKANVTEATKQNIVSQYSNSPLKRSGPKSHSYVVTLSSGQSLADAIAQYRANPNVYKVEAIRIYKTFAQPAGDLTHYHLQWGMSNTGQSLRLANGAPTAGSSGNDIGAERAWDHTNGSCENVVVAVVDTGISNTHPKLSGNLWVNTAESATPDGNDTDGNGYVDDRHGWHFGRNSANPQPTNLNEAHGTHVAGIIGADGSVANGTAGVCWKVKLMNLNVYDNSVVNKITSLGVANAIRYAVDNGAHIINLSLGFEGKDVPVMSDEMKEALGQAQLRGVLVVAAAGNNKSNNDDTTANKHIWPCDATMGNATPTSQDDVPLQNIICVAALDHRGNLYESSPFSGSNFGATSVDIGAPGYKVYSTFVGQYFKDGVDANAGFSGWNTLVMGNSATSWQSGQCANGRLLGLTPCGNSNYANNASNSIFKQYTLNSPSDVQIFINFKYAFSDLGDGFKVDVSENGNPFTTPTSNPSPLPPFWFRGSSNNEFVRYSIRGGTTHLGSYCVGRSACYLGIRFDSDASGVSTGVQIQSIEVLTFNSANTGYIPMSGTSMAAPHVSGIAAMLKSYNPNYTYSDIRNAILSTGIPVPALAGRTVTGTSANAYNALKYVGKPTGVSVAVSQ